ncbi:MAG: hypothetical protein JSS09_05440 [Verrucomicrobia bacterium]|nr:hypothetical protein [Verrucomicrobiota bacterium]
MASSGALTPEKIEALRKKMASLAEEHKASTPPSVLPVLSNKDFEKYIEQENNRFDKAVEEQAAAEKFAQKVIEAVQKKNPDSK